MDLARRRGWRRVDHAGTARVFLADTPRARLLGLALLDDLPSDVALLLPRCRSVHTLAMRFALDVVFLDAGGAPLRVDRAVAPARLRSCRRARAVLETRAGEADRLLAAVGVAAAALRAGGERW